MQAQDLVLFKAALGLSDPWQVTSVDPERKRLDLGSTSRRQGGSRARSVSGRVAR